MMKEDMHLHSNYSDGKNSLEEMIKTAISLKYIRICFTDHVRESSLWVSEYYNELLSLKRKYSSFLDIYCGVEAKVKDFKGTLDIPKKIDSEIIKVAAIHRIPNGDGDYIKINNLENNEYAKVCFIKSIEGLCINTNINRLAHPFSLLLKLGITENDEDFWKRIRYAFDNSSYSIEYNIKHDNSTVPAWIWKRYLNRIIYATDSHSVLEMELLSKKLYP